MTQVPPETKAFNQFIILALLSFIVGMAGVVVLFAWLMWRLAEPDTNWFQLLHFAVHGLIFSVVGGLALAAGATWLLDRWHHWRGVYRCPYCGRPFRSNRIPCDCPVVKALWQGR